MTTIVNDFGSIRAAMPSAALHAASGGEDRHGIPFAGADAVLKMLCDWWYRLECCEDPLIELTGLKTSAEESEWYGRAFEIEQEIAAVGNSPIEIAVKRFMLREFERRRLREEGFDDIVDNLERSLALGAEEMRS